MHAEENWHEEFVLFVGHKIITSTINHVLLFHLKPTMNGTYLKDLYNINKFA